MTTHRTVTCTLLAALLLALFPLAGVGDEKQITDVKELAGKWQGWVTSQLGTQTRVLMTIKQDGTYEASATGEGGTLTVGTYYLERGTLRYRSSRTQGSATLSEERGRTLLTLTPEGTVNVATGPAVYERLK